MELKQLFQRAKPQVVKPNSLGLNDCIVDAVSYLHDFENLEGTFHLAILGICDAVNSPDNSGCENAPDLIRSYLWGLAKNRADLSILDLGNVLGQTVSDKYWVVNETIATLAQLDIPVLVIGGSQDFSIPIVTGLNRVEELVSLCVVDSFVDYLDTDADLTSSNFVQNLLKKHEGNISQISFLGLQKCFLSAVGSNLLEKSFVDCLRLGDLRGELIRDAEPLLREASFTSFDVNAIKQSEMPSNLFEMPNGIGASDACQIAWYAGISDSNRVFGLFETNGQHHNSKASLSLSAQICWYYLDGILARLGDYPHSDLTTYSTYNFDKTDTGMGIRFFHNPISARWWVELENDSKKVVRACSEKDYRMAMNNDLPDKLWKRLF